MCVFVLGLSFMIFGHLGMNHDKEFTNTEIGNIWLIILGMTLVAFELDKFLK
jgi:hypothetical protein